MSDLFLDYVAYSQYAQENKMQGQDFFRWRCLNEETKEMYRIKAQELIADWDDEEGQCEKARKAVRNRTSNR